MNRTMIALRLAVMAAVLLAGITVAAADSDDAAAPTTNTGPIMSAETVRVYGPSTPEDADQVQAVVDKWTAAPADHREGGVVALAYVPFRAFPLIEEQAGRSDFSSQNRQWLRTFLEQNRPRMRARMQLYLRQAKFYKWNERTALSEYDQFGHKDPKWDEPAGQGILAAVSMSSLIYDKAQPPLDKAIQAGCDDPFVRYLDAQAADRLGNGDVTHENLRVAVKALLKTKYPASRKVMAAMYVFKDAYEAAYGQDLTDKEKFKQYQESTYPFILTVYNNWDRMIAEPDLPKSLIADMAIGIMDVNYWSGDDRKKYILDRFIPAVEKTFPSGAVPLICRAEFNINYAWDARGGGYANTVTPEGWKGFQARLARAHKFLEQAWAKDPTWPEIPTKMLTVAMGESMNQADMEVWYDRAMQLNPDNFDAGRSKMLYLEPKWGGSAEKVLEFGRQCVAEQNWEGRIPLLLRNAHQALAAYATDQDAYWRDPEVWQDLQSVYVPLTEGVPDNIWDRSEYCYWACRTEHWDEAAKQFQLLGDRVLVSAFSGKEAMEKMRAEAKEKASK